MTWRDKYRQGSFRGIAFNVRSVESAFGRRQVTHEYPAQDTPYTEDLGRKFDEFTIDAYLIGSSYDIARDRLIAACRDNADAGVLVHPYLGEKSVYCVGLRVRESSDEGGMAVLSLTFREAGIALYPSVVVDSAAAVTQKAEAVKSAARTSFIGKYVVDGFPGFVLDAATAQIKSFGEFFSSNTLGPINTLTNDINEFASDLLTFASSAENIALDAETAADSLIGAIEKVGSAYSYGLDALSKLISSNSGSYSGTTATPSRQQQSDNYNAVVELIRAVSLAEAAVVAVETDYSSYEDAVAARDIVLDGLDDEAESTEDDDLFSAMQALRVEVARGVPSSDSQLPRLISYTPMTTTSSLVLAYRLYGDASRADEIVSRNLPRHPSFLIGGQALEVISDAG